MAARARVQAHRPVQPRLGGTRNAVTGWRAALCVPGLLALLALGGCETTPEETVPTAAPSPVPVAATPALTPTSRPTPEPTPLPVGTPTPRSFADFGDAPDGVSAGYPNPRVIGRFPTRLSSLTAEGPGAHVRRPGLDRLGSSVTAESDADDEDDTDGVPNLVNQDAGDDGVLGLSVSLAPPRALAQLTVAVTLAPAAPAGPRRINVLIDIDRDGRWTSPAEWVLQDWEVELEPGASETFVSPGFSMLDGQVLPEGAWMRVVLTRESLAGEPWDGSGSWEFGEVEDYRLALPEISRPDGSRPALAVVECPSQLEWVEAVVVLEAACAVTNIGEEGDFTARVVRSAGSVTLVPDTVTSETLHAGATRTAAFVLVRADAETTWRVRPITVSMAGQVDSGVVVLGLTPHRTALSVRPADPAVRTFDRDAQEDYFDITNLSPTEGFGFADIQRVALGTAAIDSVGLDILRRVYFTVGGLSGAVAGDYVAAIIDMVEPIPLTDSALGWRVSLALEANDDPADNWRPRVRDFDLYQGTDHWYELIYLPTLDPAWRIQRRVALAPSQALPSNAIAFIDGRRVLLLIPESELERANADLRFRVMTFVHEPDDPSGTVNPSMADVFPPLDQPLQTFGPRTDPLG